MELNIRQDLGYIIFVLWPYVVKNQAWFKLVMFMPCFVLLSKNLQLKYYTICIKKMKPFELCPVAKLLAYNKGLKNGNRTQITYKFIGSKLDLTLTLIDQLV